jgi:uncharacterized protein (TIGR03437 family)
LAEETMDAATTFLKRIAFVFTAALLVVASASAQTLSASPNPVNLSGSLQFVTVTVSATGGTIPFSISTSGAYFYLLGFPTAGSASDSTPDTFQVGVANTAGCSVSAPCTGGKITLHPTSTSASDVVIPVTFTPGTGGGGATALQISPNPPQVLSVSQGFSTSGYVYVNTANGSSVQCSVSSNQTWLVPATTSMTVYGTAQQLSYTANSAGLFNNTQYTARVTLCGNNSAYTTNFDVTLNVGTPGGGGTATFNATPTTINLSYPSGLTSQNVTVTSTSTSTYQGYVTNVTGSTNWLLVNGYTFMPSAVSTATPATISVNASQVPPVGTYSGQVVLYNPSNGNESVTITVYLSVTSGGSSTGAIVVNPNPAIIPAALGSTGYATVQVYTANGTSTTCSVTAAATWLYPYPASLALTGTATNLSLSAFALPSYGIADNTQYTTSVTLCAGQANATSFNVTLNVGNATGSGNIIISPSTPAAINVAQGVTANGSVSVYVPSGTLSCTVSSNASWLVPQITGITLTTAAKALNYSAFTSGLSDNTSYSGTITLGCGTSQNSFNVTVNVGNAGGGGTTTGIAGPTPLSFAYQIGKSNPLAQNILIAPSGSFTATASVSTTKQWLTLGPNANTTTYSGNGPATLAINIDPATLGAGTYQGTVSISTGSGSQLITVNLLVSANPVLQASSGGGASITATWQPGGGTPMQYLQISASDGSALPVSLSTTASWITINPASSTTPANFLVTLDPSSLCNGLNTATLTMSSSSAANPTDTIPVAVLVSNNGTSTCGGTGNLTLGATQLNFTAAVNGSAPATQSLGISSTTASTFTVQYSTSSGGNWLSVTQNATTIGSGTTLNVPTNLTIGVNPTGLVAGSYTGTLAFTALGVTQNVQVNLTVSATNNVLTLGSSSVSFTSVVPGGSQTSQNVTVSSAAGSSPLNFTVATSTTTGGNWLSVSANGTTVGSGTTLATPATLAINVNPAGLNYGSTYQGTVTLTPTGGTAQTINVTVTTTAAPVVSAAPVAGGTSLTFNYRAGDNPPSQQSVSVTGGQGLTFSATAQSNPSGWLTVSPAAGTTPATISVGINPAGLSAGQYNGSITVAGTGSATGSTTIPVTLNVTAPLPTINLVSNAASYVGGSISPGEVITIFGNDLGPTPAVSSPAINTATGLVATTLGGVQVLVNGFAAPLIYVSNTQVSAVVPYEVAGFLSGTVIVKFLGQTSNGISAQIVATAPGIFTANASGTGPGAILNQNQTQNTQNNRAAKGSVISIYMTGEGQTAPKGVTGKITTVASTAPLTPAPLLGVGATIDGIPVQVQFAGEAPGIISGVLQLNVVVPPGARSGEVPLVVTIGNNSSQAGVTVWVQ